MDSVASFSPPSPPLTFKMASPREFKDLEELGCGFGGVVFKSLHLPTGRVMARKLVNSRIGSTKIRKSLTAELMTLQRCNHPNIVTCYGAYLSDMQICITMEYMDLGSFDWIRRKVGPIVEPILATMTKSVLQGLIYLHNQLNIIHRDLKPSNILFNSQGQVKLCDFGESIELVNSLARSMVGTTGYMAPERIRGQPYTIRSDIWSLGISLIELATGNYPYSLSLNSRESMSPASRSPSLGLGDHYQSGDNNGGEETKLAIVELWETISNDPSPRLDSTQFSASFVDFTNQCLMKEEAQRPDPYTLLQHPFVQTAESFDLGPWARHLFSLLK